MALLWNKTQPMTGNLESNTLTEIEVGRGAVIGQGRWGCEGMGGALVG